jgi:AcrR family transcriptional regulator
MSSAAKVPRSSDSRSRLPRGPHSLSREQVATNQRQRLMSAMIEQVGASGYTGTTVGDVIARAGVSRKAFYEHFANREECFLATYDALVAEGIERVGKAYGEANGLPSGAAAGIGELFELALENPGALRLVLIEVGAVGPAGVARRERLIGAYERLLREGLGLAAGAGAVPNPVLRAVIGGLNSVLYTRVQSRRHEHLSDLAPDLVRWVTSYYPAPAVMAALRHPRPDMAPARLVGGRAPGTLSPSSTSKRPHLSGHRQHGVSRSLVVHSQRERILDAVAQLSASKGYETFTVEDIAERAAVSLHDFYEHFSGKEDAFLVAYELGHGKVLALVERAFDEAPNWRTGISAGLQTLFEFLASEPAFAHLASVDALIATRRTAERVNKGVHAYAEMLRPGLEEATGRSVPAVAVEAIAGGLFELCFSHAVQGRVGELPGLVPHATYFALAPFVGAEEAGRLAVQATPCQRSSPPPGTGSSGIPPVGVTPFRTRSGRAQS